LADLKKLEFLILRYVPDQVKEEFVNVGIVMFDPDPQGSGFADVLFTRDWRRVRCIDPEADLGRLLRMEVDLRTQLRGVVDKGAVIEDFEKLLGDETVKSSSRRACLAEDPAAELNLLVKMYCETSTHAAARASSGRQRILKAMQMAFEQAGVLGLMQREIAAAKYTAQGDPLKIDFGYKPNGALKMLHAVSLSASLDPAKALAFSFRQMKAGARDLGEELRLTAVVDDGLDSKDKDVQLSFALNAMREAEMEVRPLREIVQLAEEVRVELRA
jgi:hypothetical protein